MIDTTSFLSDLREHKPIQNDETQYLAQTIDFVAEETEPFSRSTLHGHVTASGWIFDPLSHSVLLIYHQKLNRWLQPGGHIEPSDQTVELAARREVLEESNLQGMDIRLPNNGIFDIDIHTIPTREGTSRHQHFDIRYLYLLDSQRSIERAPSDAEMRWIHIDQITSLTGDIGVMRMMEKVKSFSCENTSPRGRLSCL